MGSANAPLSVPQPLPAMGVKPLTKANSHQLAGAGHYLSWREQMMKEIENGKKPDPGLLTLLEASLYKLSDDDLREEYRWYAERYMSDDSSELLRAACEMIVIHIGEVVNMPQGARVDRRKHNKRLNEAQVTPRANNTEDGPDYSSPGGPDFDAYSTLRDSMVRAQPPALHRSPPSATACAAPLLTTCTRVCYLQLRSSTLARVGGNHRPSSTLRSTRD